LLACYVGKGKGMRTHKNRAGHGLALHTSGVKTYLFDNGLKITVRPNEIIFLPKHSTYRVYSEEEGDCYAINFDVAEEKRFTPFAAKVKNAALFLRLFKTAKADWEQKPQGFAMSCKASLYRIIYALVQEYFSQYLSNDKLRLIQPGIDYIRREYNKRRISIKTASDLCGITPEYFRKIFKSRFGASPVKYVNELKISHAKSLLSSGMYSVTEAAVQSGYTDMSFFSREFKKYASVTPKEFLSSTDLPR
ncbi:MAG: helix-turn-helix transcriptional regulator, partial [Candidatus Neoclostridium sp.]